jgi:hypothetical protein
VIHFGPESYCQGSGSFVMRGGGGSWKIAIVLLRAHTSSKNPRPISGMQAYIAYLFSSLISEGSVLICSDTDLVTFVVTL